MPLPVLAPCLPARRRVSARAWAASGRPRPHARRAGGNQSASLGSTSLTGWLKYRVLDESGNEQASGRDYLLGTGKWEYLQTGVRIEQAGTVEVMAGTSGSGEAVYFDNLRVEQTGGLIVQEQHQYAFGAPLPGLSYVVGSTRYRYGYQGQYAERDSVTGFESFELRLYNSRVGRWMSYDPEEQFSSPYVGMGNNPVSGVDPDGGWSGGGGLAKGLSRLKTGEIVATATRASRVMPAVSTAVRAISTTRAVARTAQNGYAGSYFVGRMSADVPTTREYYADEAKEVFNDFYDIVDDVYKGAQLPFLGERRDIAGRPVTQRESASGFYQGLAMAAGSRFNIPAPYEGVKQMQIGSKYGEIIGWGEHGAGGIKTTETLTRTLTRADVNRMAGEGVPIYWIVKQLDLYNRALADPKKATNVLLPARKALMEKILSSW